jgi:murein DD-endopeptidase MepM/ murein hydrolase activator NlpD
MRLLASGAVAVAIWLAVATQVPAHPSMRLADVVVGAAITQPFGCTSLELEPFDDLCPWHHKHTGVDLAAAIGTEVHSATNGTALAGFDGSGCGVYVLVVVDAHVRALYCHLSVVRVPSGSSVQPGQVIGLVGDTGLTTGPHVHLQVDVDGVPVDPTTWLGP